MTDKGTGMDREFDLLTMGRSSIDLYANEVGAVMARHSSLPFPAPLCAILELWLEQFGRKAA